jgi:hypothetical protein
MVRQDAVVARHESKRAQQNEAILDLVDRRLGEANKS